MKIRSDFVTNSSSSSFVIAYRDMPQVDEDTLKKYPFVSLFPKLIDAIMNCKNDEDTTSAEIYRTKESFDEFIVDRFGWGSSSTVKSILGDGDFPSESYDNAIRYLENGYNIAYKQVGYDDDGVSDIISTLAEDNENFVIIF